MNDLDRAYQILRKPVITEKSTDDSAIRNAYHFRVPIQATKSEIRSAVETIFEVRVRSVNTLRTKPKWRRRGYTVGTTRAWKKAMVVLAEDQTIDIL